MGTGGGGQALLQQSMMVVPDDGSLNSRQAAEGVAARIAFTPSATSVLCVWKVEDYNTGKLQHS